MTSPRRVGYPTGGPTVELPHVVLEPGAPLDAALKDLKARVGRAGIIEAVRQRVAARSPGERRRAKHRRAMIRERRRAQREAAG